ncbi:hypothetical protein HH297_08210, partial [Xanthomonas sp. Kuri4-3]
MPSITEMISAIFFEDASMPLIVVTTWPTTSPPPRGHVGGTDGELVGLAGVFGVLLDGGGQLLHRGGGLLQAGGL